MTIDIALSPEALYPFYKKGELYDEMGALIFTDLCFHISYCT